MLNALVVGNLQSAAAKTLFSDVPVFTSKGVEDYVALTISE